MTKTKQKYLDVSEQKKVLIVSPESEVSPTCQKHQNIIESIETILMGNTFNFHNIHKEYFTKHSFCDTLSTRLNSYVHLLK